MKHLTLRKAVAYVLMLVMTLSTVSFTPIFANTAQTSDFIDFPTGWSKEAVTAAVNNGLLNGRTPNTIVPEGNLTRAEMATVINRAFGATVVKDISSYLDVIKGEWYYSEMQKAVNMQTFQGDGNNMLRPDDFITREEVFAVLARAFVLTPKNMDALNRFTDASLVSEWARPYAISLVERGYVNGDENAHLNPLYNITREEFAQILHNMIKQYITKPGEYKSVVSNGNVLIRVPGVTLTGVTVNGDLILGDGVGTGDITLNKVKITGRLLARGGSGKVTLKETSVGESVVVNNVNGPVNFNNYESEEAFKNLIENTEAAFIKKPGAVGGGGGGGYRPGTGDDDKDDDDTPVTDTYIVRHYKETLAGGYEEVTDDKDVLAVPGSGRAILVPKNYSADGFYLDPDLTIPDETIYNRQAANGIEVAVAKDNVFKIYYSRSKPVLTLVTNGGSLPGGKPNTITFDSGADILPTLSLSEPTKADVTFEGWYKEPSFGADTKIPSSGEVTITTNMTLYARWTVTVTFNGTGHSVTLDPGASVGSDMPDTSGTPNFAGWYTEPGGSGTLFTAVTPVYKNMTVYSHTVPGVTMHTVTFDYGYSEGLSTENKKVEVQVPDNTAVEAPSTPGYKDDTKSFVSWRKGSVDAVAYNFSTLVTESFTLYATWADVAHVTNYKVTFDYGDGTTKVVDVVPGQLVAMPENKNIYGRSFVAWYSDEDLNNEFYFSTTYITGDITLYAKWTDATYQVQFVYEGVVKGTVTITHNSKVDVSDVPDISPIPAGHMLKWYAVIGGVKKEVVPSDVSITESITFEAKIEPKTWTVSFVTNGGSSLEPMTVTNGKALEDYDDALSTTTKDGALFLEWHTADTLNAPHSDGAPIEDDTVLYANWQYTVNIDPNNGWVDAYNRTYTHGENAASELAEPAAPSDGATNFAGWYRVDERGEFGGLFSATSAITSSLNLKAKWIDEDVIKWTVTYDYKYDGKVTSDGVPDGDMIIPPELTRQGFDFKGWYVEGGNQFDHETTSIEGNTNLYALWTVHKHTVTFSANGGSFAVSGSGTQEVSHNETAILPTVSYDGYDFVSWETANGEVFTETTPVTASIFVKAKWAEKTVNIFIHDGTNGVDQTVSPSYVPDAPSPRDGYSFKGWYVNDPSYNDTNKLIAGTTVLKEDDKLYAYWEPKTYSVTFYNYNIEPIKTLSNLPHNYIIHHNEAPDMEEIETALGYVFEGWHTSMQPAPANHYDLGKTPVTDNLSLYPAHLPDNRIITGDPEGAEIDNDPEPQLFSLMTLGEDAESAPEIQLMSLMPMASEESIVVYNEVQITKAPSEYGEPVKLKKGDKKDSLFIGWYTDKNYNTPFDPSKPLFGDLFLYSKWLYSVTYNLQDGSDPIKHEASLENETAGLCAVHGQPIKNLMNPTRDGFNFAGWYTDSACTHMYAANTPVTDPITLYAKWTEKPIIYNEVTFNYNFDGKPAETVQVVQGSLISMPATPDREGYTFAGWYSDAAFAHPFDFASTQVTDNINLYARWTTEEYTVTFREYELNSTTQKVAYNQKANSYVPAREGFAFDGWYLDAALSRKYSFDTPVTGDLTLYAAWSVRTFAIHFEERGGNQVFDITNIRYGEVVPAASIPENPVREGFIFNGWHTDPNCADGCTNMYDFSKPITEDVVIWAKWKPIEYEVKFMDGDTQWGATVKVTHGSALAEPISPTKGGSIFAGWFREKTGSNRFDFATEHITANTTLYAHWTIKRYTITYDTNGGTPVDPDTGIKHGSKLISPIPPAREGFTFVAWYTDPSLTGLAFDFNTTPIDHDYTLYAKWKVVTHTVQFANRYLAIDPVDVFYGSLVSRPADHGTQEGKTFGGWYTDTTWQTEFDFDTTPIKKDTVIYAKWDTVRVTVTYVTNGGDAKAPDVLDYGSHLDIKNATKQNAIFDDWYTDKELRTQFSEGVDGIISDITLYAGWKYTVTFNTMGGSAVDTKTDVKHNEIIDEPGTPPAKDGYKFTGWYIDEACTTAFAFASTAITDSITLYAGWAEQEVVKHQVTFNNNGSISNDNVPHGSTVTAPTVSEREGFEFKYWYIEGQTQAFDFATPITEKLTLIAKWDIVKYNVTFVSHGQQIGNVRLVEHGTQVADVPVLSDNAQYTFDSWTPDTSISITKDTVFTANWKLKSYSLSYESPGFADGRILITEMSYGSVLNEPAAPAKEGYIFSGWYEDDTLTKAFSFGGNFVEDVTIYAKWTKINYKADFVVDDKIIASVFASDDNLIGSDGFPADPVKEGYRFDGWAYPGGAAFDITVPLTADITLVPTWQILTYKAYLYLKTEDVIDPVEVKLNYGSVLPIPGANRLGHTLEGWYTDEALTQKYDFTTIVKADFNLYAKWTPNVYKVTFRAEGSTIGECEVPYQNGIPASQIPAISDKYGYNTPQWTLDGSPVDPAGYVVEARTEFVASWQPNKARIEFYSNITDVDTGIPGIDYYSGKVFELPGFDYTYDNYKFIGWSTNDSKDNIVVDYYPASETSFMVETDGMIINLYAVWAPDYKYITYKSGHENAQGDMYDTAFLYGDEVRLRENAFTLEGYEFKGWGLDENAATVDYINGQAVTFADNVTLYARWEEKDNVNVVTFYEGVRIVPDGHKHRVQVVSGNTVKESDISAAVGAMSISEYTTSYKSLYKHTAYPSLWYKDEAGKWRIFDNGVVIDRDIDVFYGFKVAKVAFNTFKAGATSLSSEAAMMRAPYDADSRLTQSMIDLMLDGRSVITKAFGKGEAGNENYASLISEIAGKSKGILDETGNIKYLTVDTAIKDIISADEISGEIRDYIVHVIEDKSSGSKLEEALLMVYKSDKFAQAMLDNVQIDWSVMSEASYIAEMKKHIKTLETPEQRKDLAHKMIDALQQEEFYVEFINSFKTGAKRFAVNKENINFVMAMAHAVGDYTYEELSKRIESKFGSIIEIIGDVTAAQFMFDAQTRYSKGADEIWAAYQSGTLPADQTYPTYLTFRLNPIDHMFVPVYKKYVEKDLGRFKENNEAYHYDGNVALRDFVNRLQSENLKNALVDYVPFAADEKRTGYVLKDNALYYYDYIIESLINFENALTYYQDNLSSAQYQDIVTLAYSDMADYFCRANRALGEDGTVTKMLSDLKNNPSFGSIYAGFESIFNLVINGYKGSEFAGRDWTADELKENDKANIVIDMLFGADGTVYTADEFMKDSYFRKIVGRLNLSEAEEPTAEAITITGYKGNVSKGAISVDGLAITNYVSMQTPYPPSIN